MSRQTQSLAKNLGLWDVFAIASGAMISSGLFVLPGIAFARVGPAMVFCYAVAGVLILPTMFSKAELATAMPKSGGSYFAVERSLGAYFGTVAGLINWCVISLKAAFALVGVGTIAVIVLPEFGGLTLKLTAIAVCLIFAAMNLFSVEHTGKLQGILVAGLLAILIGYIIWAAPAIQPKRFFPIYTGTYQTFLAVTGMVFISYGGLTHVVEIAEEVRNPGRNVPLGMFLAFGVVNSLYVAAVLVTVGILPAEQLSGSLKPIAEGARIIAGTPGYLALGLAALLAYATTGNAGILSASRSPMAMGRDGLLPEVLTRTSKRFHTPFVSVILTATVMVLVMAFLSIENMVKTASTMFLISMALINVAVVILRHARIEGYRPSFKAPLCPWLQILSVILYVFLIIEMGMIPLLITAGFIAMASLWYIFYVQKRIDREAAVVFLVKSIISRHIQRTGLEDELVQISLERDEIHADRFDQLVRQAPIVDLKEPVTATQLFKAIGDAMADRLSITADEIADRLLEREKESSTMILPGLAIPHVVVPGNKIFELALVRCTGGAIFSELNPPVHTAFVLLGSVDERDYHLKALMAIAHVVQEPNFRQRWLNAPHTEQLRDIVLLASRKRH